MKRPAVDPVIGGMAHFFECSCPLFLTKLVSVMSDRYLPLVFFTVLASIAVFAAISGSKAGRSGLIGLFAVAWVLLIVWWMLSVPDWQVTFATVVVVSVIFAFALLVVFFPMSLAVEGRSFIKLLALGIVGAAVSAVASLWFGLFVGCLFLGECV